MKCNGTTMIGFDVVDGKCIDLGDFVRCATCQTLLPDSFLYRQDGTSVHVVNTKKDATGGHAKHTAWNKF